MKLMIEILEKDFHRICQEYISFSDTLEGRGLSAIAEGTPIPNNATNGDVMKIIFPKMGVYDEWYDEPYQKEDKNE